MNLEEKKLYDFSQQIFRILNLDSNHSFNDDISNEIIDIYLNFLLDYLKEVKGKKSWLQFKILLETEVEINKNALESLQVDLQEANQEFLKSLNVLKKNNF